MKKLVKLLLALFPTKLPQGVPQFHAWADGMIALYDFPTKDVDSIKFALASMVLHLGATSAYKSKFYFFLSISAGAAKQVAGSIFYEIKQKQQQEAAAAAEAHKLELVTSNGPTQQ